MSAHDADRTRQLWLAVIQQALDDATTAGGFGTWHHKEIARDTARHWLMKPNRDFNEICHLAGLDPQAVREAATRVIEAYDADPERTKEYEFEGERHTVPEWAKRLGLNHAVLHGRLKSGWPVGEALTAPVGLRAPRKRRRMA